MLVSTPDRHLVFFGTETTIGTKSTQDDMFIRFSDQEDINTYTPTATNTAGTQRLADGSKSWELLEVEMQSMFMDRHSIIFNAFCRSTVYLCLSYKQEVTVD